MDHQQCLVNLTLCLAHIFINHSQKLHRVCHLAAAAEQHTWVLPANTVWTCQIWSLMNQLLCDYHVSHRQIGTPDSTVALCRKGVSSTRTMSWFPESDTSVNITIVITTPGADYTALRSFGSAADFGDNLVNSMDRSYELRNGRKPKKPVQVCTARMKCLFLSFLLSVIFEFCLPRCRLGTAFQDSQQY